MKGQLVKMPVALGADQTAQYTLQLDEQQLDMNALLGQTITLRYEGQINCLHCDRKTKKSFSGGFCYPCSQKLAQCDLCFMKPETCHYAAGTCREPEWGEAVCMQDHIVYLANSSGLKVGITRINQIPTRWIDQGATQAIPIFRIKTRYQSGLVEIMFKQHVSDRTDWRKMLKGQAEVMDLAAERDRLFELTAADLATLKQDFDDADIQALPAEQAIEIAYPVNQYPTKVSSLNFDKTAEISGTLQGIKGQYLILDTGVLNIRKFSGYQIEVNI
jgi:hypothetical protein